MKKKYKIGLLIIASIGVIAYITRDTPKQKEAKYIRQGNEFFEKGNHMKARVAYKNAAKLFPTDPEVGYRWGLVDESEGDIRNAFTNFMAAEQQNAHFTPAVQKIAHYLIAANQLDQAQKRVDVLLADGPQDAEAHALAGALLLQKKDLDASEKEVRIALGFDPANITAISVLAGIYMEKKDIAKAGEALEDGIKRNPTTISLLMLKAKIYTTPFNADKVKEAYQAIFALKPEETQYRYYLAQSFIAANKIDDAEATLRAAVKDIPDNWDVKQLLVNFLGQYRSVDAADQEIHDLMKQYPANTDLYLWLASLYASHNQTDKAIAALQQLIAKNSDDKQSLSAKTSLARISFAKGNKEMAENIVTAVLKVHPSNRDALLVRANMEAERSQYENAVTDLRTIIRDDPKAKEARQLLGEVLLIQGYTDLAIDIMNQLVDLDPKDPATRTRLAQMYSLNKNAPKGLEQLNIVTTDNPKYPVGWETTARIAIGLKDYDLANTAIAKLDALDGQHLVATYLKGQLAAVTGHGDEALVLYKKVIDENPSTPLAEHALLSLVEEHHGPDEIEKTTNYIASLKTENPFVLTLLGEGYLRLGKTEPATEALEKAIANHPTTQDAYLDLANILLQAKKVDEATEVLKKAAIDVPSDIRAPILRGTILYGQQKYKEAVELYESMLQANPAIGIAANNMASVIADHFYTDPEMLEKGRKAVERFANSQDPSLLDSLGWTYYRMGKLDQAQTTLARATSGINKIPPEIHYHYGVVLAKAGNKPKAKEQLMQAVGEDAHYPALDDAKKLLATL